MTLHTMKKKKKKQTNKWRFIIDNVYLVLWATTTKTVCKEDKDYDTLEELPSTSTYKRDVRIDQWHTGEQIKKILIDNNANLLSTF